MTDIQLSLLVKIFPTQDLSGLDPFAAYEIVVKTRDYLNKLLHQWSRMRGKFERYHLPALELIMKQTPDLYPEIPVYLAKLQDCTDFLLEYGKTAKPQTLDDTVGTPPSYTPPIIPPDPIPVTGRIKSLRRRSYEYGLGMQARHVREGATIKVTDGDTTYNI
jgi:hypothetical protein